MYVTYTRIYGWSDYGGESSYQPGYRLENMMWMTLLVYDYIIPGEISMGAVRTVAVQVSEELFQRLKVVIGKKHMKQKDFLIQIIEEALEKAEAEWQSKDQPEESEQTTGELGTEETQPEERTEPERESEPEEEAEPDGESEPKEENKPEGESEPEEETEPEGETDPEESKAEEPTEW